MYQRAFIVVSDNSFFPGLWALLNSILAYYEHEYRVFIVGHHLSSSAVADLRHHPLASAITLLDDRNFAYRPLGAWEAKQSTLSHICGQVATVCLLDADIVLLSRLDDAFESAENGLLVTCEDGQRDFIFDETFRAYDRQLVGKCIPYFNSGFLCLNLLRHWELAALWEFTSRFAAYSPSGGKPYGFSGYGDQGILNALVALLDKQAYVSALSESLWCNSAGWSSEETVDIVGTAGPMLEVRHRRLGHRQRLLHSTGPKWWTSEGREHFVRSGDVLKCFEHFAQLHPLRWPTSAVGETTSQPGVLRYKGDISRQDAQVLAEHVATAQRILEFGVGGSTQILAQIAPPGAVITAVETDPNWVQKTRESLQELRIGANVQFVAYQDWVSMDVGLIDMVFIDGVDHLRREFAERSWGFLRIGGIMLIHDTRRIGDAAYALDFVRLHHLEVQGIELNLRASNITLIRKKVAEPYVNWNLVEDMG
jgi:hypothetical protein